MSFAQFLFVYGGLMQAKKVSTIYRWYKYVMCDIDMWWHKAAVHSGNALYTTCTATKTSQHQLAWVYNYLACDCYTDRYFPMELNKTKTELKVVCAKHNSLPLLIAPYDVCVCLCVCVLVAALWIFFLYIWGCDWHLSNNIGTKASQCVLYIDRGEILVYKINIFVMIKCVFAYIVWILWNCGRSN